MDVALISANGQITLPVGVRRRLGLGTGDKVVFVENAAGDIVVVRPSVAALVEAQRAFAGAAADAEFEDDADLERFIEEARFVRADRRNR